MKIAAGDGNSPPQFEAFYIGLKINYMEALVAVAYTPSKLFSKAPDSAKIHGREGLIFRSDWSNLGNPDDVMETSLTIHYDKQWLNVILQSAHNV